MIRKLMASSALIALMSAGAISVAQAQSDPATPVTVQDNAAAVPDSNAAPTTELAASSQAIAPDQPTLASTIIGKSVFSSSDPESDNIGDVNDLIVAEDGSITHAVIGVGGFLGIGEKNVAVPFDELKVVENNGDLRLVYSATKEQLEAAPAFDRTAYDPAARGAPVTSTAATDATGVTQPVEPAPTGDMAAAPAPADEQTAATDATGVTPPVEPAPTGDMAAAPAPADEQTAATDATGTTPPVEPAPTGDIAAAPADEQTAATDATGTTPPVEPAPTGDMAAAPAPADEQTAANDAAGTTPPVEPAPTGDLAAAPAPTDEQTAASGSTAATSDQMAASETDNASPAATTEQPADATADVAATDNIVPPAGDIAFVNASPGQVRANWLIGKGVYGPDNQSIGEVHDLVLQKDTGIRVALIDVGGFLGIGEKTVAIPFTDLKFTKLENSTEPQVTVAMSKDELNNQPAYDTAALENSAAATPPPAPEATDTTMATNGTTADQTAPSTTDQTAATDMAAPDPTADLTTGSVSPSQDVAASKLIGATVYASDDSNIGEVGDIVFNDKGDIDAIVVDVGGFLGIGEKPVALSFDKLNMRTDQNGYLSLVVSATKDELNNAPAYETIVQ